MRVMAFGVVTKISFAINNHNIAVLSLMIQALMMSEPGSFSLSFFLSFFVVVTYLGFLLGYCTYSLVVLH